MILGDLMDFDLISSHNLQNLRAVEGQRILEQYTEANRLLDELQQHTKKITITEGNHDERIERYIDANPVVEGMLELENGLRLKERKIDLIRYRNGGSYRLGKARFFHGIYTNQFHAKKTVENFGDNIFYGHTHDVQSYSKELRGQDKTLVGQSLGCLCRYDMAYMKGRPSKWQQAFGVFYFKPDGFFQYEVVRIFKNEFVWKGRLYD